MLSLNDYICMLDYALIDNLLINRKIKINSLGLGIRIKY